MIPTAVTNTGSHMLAALCLPCPASHNDSLWKTPNSCLCQVDGMGNFLGFLFQSELGVCPQPTVESPLWRAVSLLLTFWGAVDGAPSRIPFVFSIPRIVLAV